MWIIRRGLDRSSALIGMGSRQFIERLAIDSTTLRDNESDDRSK